MVSASDTSSLTTTAWIQAGATVILVVVTIYYAIQTHKLAGQADKERRRALSLQAGYRALDALREPSLQQTEPSEIEVSVCRDLHRTLHGEAALITDGDEIVERLRACANAAFECANGGTRMKIQRDGEEVDAVVVSGVRKLLLRQIVQETRYSLEDYLAERPLRAWNDLPRSTGAQAWIVDRAK